MSVAEEVSMVHKEGVQVAIVVGGGNYFRGSDAIEGLDRVTADYMGMLATSMNAVCLQSALEGLGVDTRVQTAIEMRVNWCTVFCNWIILSGAFTMLFSVVSAQHLHENGCAFHLLTLGIQRTE